VFSIKKSKPLKNSKKYYLFSSVLNLKIILYILFWWFKNLSRWFHHNNIKWSLKLTKQTILWTPLSVHSIIVRVKNLNTKIPIYCIISIILCLKGMNSYILKKLWLINHVILDTSGYLTRIQQEFVRTAILSFFFAYL